MSQDIWVEKYRPMSLNEVINQEDLVKRLKLWVNGGEIQQHLLLAGPSGIGKTTIALCVARDYLKPIEGQSLADTGAFIEMNASDERRLEDIRGRLKTFLSTKSVGGKKKIVVLDECDNMASNSQPALRRMLERWSHLSRFILTANYLSGIIEPLQSRCAVFRLSFLRENDVLKALIRVCKAENLALTKDAFKLIFNYSQGDLRKAINLLQACSTKSKITSEIVNEILKGSVESDVTEMLTLAEQGKYVESIQKLKSILYNRGVQGRDLISAISQVLVDKQNFKIMSDLTETEWRVSQGANEEIQLAGFLLKLKGV